MKKERAEQEIEAVLMENPSGLRPMEVADAIGWNSVSWCNRCLARLAAAGRAVSVPDPAQHAANRVRWTAPQHRTVCQASILRDRAMDARREKRERAFGVFPIKDDPVPNAVPSRFAVWAVSTPPERIFAGRIGQYEPTGSVIERVYR
jgi:hypothetical protein